MKELVGVLRAQAYRLGTGALTDGRAAMLRDGLTARAGDIIATRENNRRLKLNRGKDFVKNNDVWTVNRVHNDGSLTVRHSTHRGAITLPADYVQKNTMIGYAATIHRSQGITCDTTHALITSGLTRALAYVAASRGKFMNKLYGAVNAEEGETLESVLAAVAANHDGNLTAHEQMDVARAQARSLPQVSAAYQDIDDQANEMRMENTARRVLGDGRAGPFIDSDAWGAIATHLRAAEKEGFNLTNLLTESFADREFNTAEDETAVMAWRIENRLDSWRALSRATQHRLLENISDAHLAELQRRTAGQLARARADAGAHGTQPGVGPAQLGRDWLKERKNTPWQNRLHGHLTDDELHARILAAQAKANTDTTINDPGDTRKTRWLLSSLQREQALRELQHPQARADQAFERGAVTNYRREPGVSRVKAAEQLHRRVSAEIALRRHLPDLDRQQPAAPDKLPTWLAPADVLTHTDTPALWRKELLARRELMVTEANRLGSQLADTPPAWAKKLGPVPSDPAKQEQWRMLAVEVAVYRQTYRVPDSEATPIPAEHRKHAAGAELSARITAMHKYTAQTHKEPLSGTDASVLAEAAEVQARVKETPTPAEEVVDQLRQTRARENDLTPAQQRAARIADLARKSRARKDSLEAVSEAMENIKARRAAEEARRRQARPDDDPAPRPERDRGPGHGR